MLLLSFFVFSCKTENPAAKLAAEITALEAEIGADPGATQAKIPALLAKYEEYVALKEGSAEDKVKYLLRAGEMAALVGQNGKSLGYYDQVISQFPDSPKAATALFMKGYTLDDKLGRIDEAKAVYEEFLKKYPDDDFADDTQFLLKNLGKTEEEIIKQFEAK